MILGSQTAKAHIPRPLAKATVERHLTRKKKPGKGCGYPRNEQGLSQLQMEVIKFIAQGLSNEEIADKMNTNGPWVINTKSQAIKALGAKNPAHLMVVCYQKGILKTGMEGDERA